MTKYKEFIYIDKEFQYSINLQYDLNKLSKINGYIPTTLSIEVLKTLLQSIYDENSKERANVLIGPYGKGKSHLLLILLAIISLKEDIEDEKLGLKSNDVITNLIKKIKNVDSGTGEIIKEIRKYKKRFLPVVINSSYMSLNQAFMIGLKNALEKENLVDLIPNSYFEAVNKTINNWKKNYPEAYEKFEYYLRQYDFKIENFIININNYDENTYELFKQIYPKITHGSEFNPLIDSNVVKLYEEINYKLCENYNYDGMFIVFDEFSKFIESSVERNVCNDLKLIQDFAELASRSGKKQMHFLCITHKAINDYMVNIPKEKIDAWRAVEGRFKEIYFTSSSQQNYELIANTIKKDNEKFSIFLRQNELEYNEKITKCLNLGLFDDIYNSEEIVARGCFPLNPISVYVLPRISEKVAQNERTLFTFLSKNEKGSLYRFINNNDDSLKFLTLDYIYDYFEILFKKDIFNKNVHMVWLKTSNALKKIEDEIQKKIIKTIAIIYIVNELDKLRPVDYIIQNALNLEKDEYDVAIKNLLNKSIIRKRPIDNFYVFSSEVYSNIKVEIKKVKETKISNINVCKTLENIVPLGYVTPKKYNDQYEMIRFFKNLYITIEELETISDAKYLLDLHNSDGLILHLIYINELDKQKAIKKIQQLNNKRIFLCIPNEPFNKFDVLKEIEAIQYLKINNELFKDNEILIDELQVYELDLIELIHKYINKNFNIQYNNCKYYSVNGEISDIKKSHHLNRKISDVCEEIFNKTPIINNEMINKINPSIQIIKARNKVIEFLIADRESNEDLSGTSAEATIYRATIKNKGLNIYKESNDNNLNEVLIEIENFIISSETNKRNFKDLYSKLTGEGYGIRKGIIPIYLTLILKKYKKEVVIFKGDKEVVLSVDTINAINNNPEQYFILLEKGTKEKEDYIQNLHKLFGDYRNNKQIGYSKYGDIVIAMQNWIHSLPKYSREFEVEFINDQRQLISKEIVTLRKELLKYEINPREFLFERLKNRILKEDSFENCYKKLKEIKMMLDSQIMKIKSYLVEKTKKIFDENYNGELSTLLIQWYMNLDENIKKQVFDEVTTNVLNFLSELNIHNDFLVVEKLARIITGLNIEDWNDETLIRYIDGITNVKNNISNSINEVATDLDESYEVSFNENGKKIDKIFKIQKISPLGMTLLDELEQNLDDYAESIDINEKRNILMELLKRLM